jgi:hypothetical protein
MRLPTRIPSIHGPHDAVQREEDGEFLTLVKPAGGELLGHFMPQRRAVCAALRH